MFHIHCRHKEYGTLCTQNKVGVVLITRGTKLTIVCCFSCTFFTAYILISAIETIFTSIIRITQIISGNLRTVLANQPEMVLGFLSNLQLISLKEILSFLLDISVTEVFLHR